MCAIRQLRKNERLDLKAIRTRLNALTAAELEAFAMQAVTPGTLAAALGVQPVAAGISLSSAAASVAPSGSTVPPTAHWRRVQLALELELHLREDASAQVMELAERVTAALRDS